MNLQNRKRHTDLEMNLWLPVYPVLFKLDNQEGHIAHGTLLNVMWNLDGRGVWGRMDTCICMAESLLCASEPMTALLISYTPMQNKKFKNKQKQNHALQEDKWTKLISASKGIWDFFEVSTGEIEFSGLHFWCI